MGNREWGEESNFLAPTPYSLLPIPFFASTLANSSLDQIATVRRKITA